MPASISVLDESRFGRFRQTAFRSASTSPHLAGLSDSTVFQEIAFDSKFFSLNQRVTCVASHCSSRTTLGTTESLTATYSLSDKGARFNAPAGVLVMLTLSLSMSKSSRNLAAIGR